MKLRLSISLFLLVIGEAALAQYGNFPLNNDFLQLTANQITERQYNFHTSLKPYNPEEFNSLKIKLKSLDLNSNSEVISMLINADTMSPLKRQIHISLAPIVDVMYSQGISNDSTDTGSNLGIGVDIGGFVGRKLTFGVQYLYSSSQYADYVESRINNRGVIPGLGKATERNGAWRNKYYTWNLNYTPLDYLNLQVGRGKHFIGNGYRSLILSDNGNSYPYFRLTLKIWKIKYQVLYSNYKSLEYNAIDGVTSEINKYATSNYLSMNFGKNFNVGLFQTVVWNGNSETGRGFDVNYLNPFIFFRPVEFSLGSPDNMLLGLDFKYSFYKKYTIYTQIILDEFLLDNFKANNGWWGNKYGYQIGIKGNDLLRIKGFSALAEYNFVRPYTYSHGNSNQNYANENQELAHPLGANFYEFVGRLSYSKKRWLFSWHSTFAEKGEDFISPNTNYGGNIFKSNQSRESDYGNTTGQGLSTRRQYHLAKIGYLIIPDSRWMIEMGYSHRSNQYIESANNPAYKEVNNMFHIGIKTLLNNQYLDF